MFYARITQEDRKGLPINTEVEFQFDTYNDAVNFSNHATKDEYVSQIVLSNDTKQLAVWNGSWNTANLTVKDIYEAIAALPPSEREAVRQQLEESLRSK